MDQVPVRFIESVSSISHLKDLEALGKLASNWSHCAANFSRNRTYITVFLSTSTAQGYVTSERQESFPEKFDVEIAKYVFSVDIQIDTVPLDRYSMPEEAVQAALNLPSASLDRDVWSCSLNAKGSLPKPEILRNRKFSVIFIRSVANKEEEIEELMRGHQSTPIITLENIDSSISQKTLDYIIENVDSHTEKVFLLPREPIEHTMSLNQVTHFLTADLNLSVLEFGVKFEEEVENADFGDFLELQQGKRWILQTFSGKHRVIVSAEDDLFRIERIGNVQSQ